MTREEAIDLLSMIEFEQAECCLNTWYKGIDDDMKEALDLTIKALEQTRWIPVSQKLPDKYGIYLVTLNNHDTDFCEFYPNDRTFGMHGNVCYEVTAWMPLPEPYKGESEESDADSD